MAVRRRRPSAEEEEVEEVVVPVRAAMVAKNGGVRRASRVPGRRGARRDLNPLEKRQLVRALATLGTKPLTELCEEWQLSYDSLIRFRDERLREIDAVAENLDDQFAGMWIADKQARVNAYMDEFRIAMENKNMSHHEWIKTRAALMRAVAEELGQLPGRGGIVVIPVEHVYIGVDVEDLK